MQTDDSLEWSSSQSSIIREFVSGPLTSAFASKGFALESSENSSIHVFLNDFHATAKKIKVFVETLGSNMTITGMVLPDGPIRTLVCPARGVRVFLALHLVEWLTNAGKYATVMQPHFQGLSEDLLRRIMKYLDAKSNSAVFSTGKQLRAMLKPKLFRTIAWPVVSVWQQANAWCIWGGVSLTSRWVFDCELRWRRVKELRTKPKPFRLCLFGN